MDNPVETPLPDGWAERTMPGGLVSFENLLTRSTTSIRPAYPASYYYVTPRPRVSDPGDLNAPELRKCPRDSLGYVSDGIFIPMYDPPKKVKDVGHVTITNEKGWGSTFQMKMIAVSKSKARGTAVVMDNLLFSCEDDPEDTDGLIFIQKPWPTDGEDIIVRALRPEALRGKGTLVQSNRKRVHVIDATLRHAKRGYLAVQDLVMVEAFLNGFSLESRFDGYRDSETDEGNQAPSFVVEDDLRSKGYYITARKSSENPTRIICHLKKRSYGPAKTAMRGILSLDGPNKLTHWVRAQFPYAQTLLFA